MKTSNSDKSHESDNHSKVGKIEATTNAIVHLTREDMLRGLHVHASLNHSEHMSTKQYQNRVATEPLACLTSEHESDKGEKFFISTDATSKLTRIMLEEDCCAI